MFCFGSGSVSGFVGVERNKAIIGCLVRDTLLLNEHHKEFEVNGVIVDE